MGLTPLICQQCGGRINPSTLRCEHCDTAYRDDSPKSYTITVEKPGVHTIRAEVWIPMERIVYMPPTATEEYALSELRRQMADALLGFMKIAAEEDPRLLGRRIRGEVRVVDPKITY